MGATCIVKATCGVDFMKSSSLKITQLHADLWVIEDTLSNENSMSYVLCGSKVAVVFDTGIGLSPLLPWVQNITSLPIIACLSHWHFDHSGGAHEFTKLLAWESPAMQHAAANGISRAVIESEVGSAFWKSIGGEAYDVHSFSQITFLNDEQTISLGGYELKVIHTPGHTKDSICLYEPYQKWLFAGDTIYHGPIYLQFDDSDSIDYATSIKKLREYNIETVFPGHNHHSLTANILKDIDKLVNNEVKSVAFPRLAIVS